MKLPVALSLFSLALLAAAHAEEGTKPSLIVRWTPAGGEAVEMKMPEVSLDNEIIVPVERGGGEVGDPAWHARFYFEVSEGIVDVDIEDHSRLRQTKDHALQPLKVFSAYIPFAWNEEVVVLESRRGKLSFVAAGREAAVTKEGAASPTTASLESPEAFAKQLQATLARVGSQLRLRLYNPTDRATKSVHVRVVAPATGDLPGFDRVYEMRISCPPLSESSNSIELGSLSDYPNHNTTRQRTSPKSGDPTETPEPPDFQLSLEKAF